MPGGVLRACALSADTERECAQRMGRMSNSVRGTSQAYTGTPVDTKSVRRVNLARFGFVGMVGVGFEVANSREVEGGDAVGVQEAGVEEFADGVAGEAVGAAVGADTEPAIEAVLLHGVVGSSSRGAATARRTGAA